MKRFLALCLLSSTLAVSALAQSSDNDKSQQNLRDCLAGFDGCDRSLLSAEQAEQIAEFRHDRNLWQCLSGYSCDRSLLNELESKEVAEAERLRNLLDCETTFGLCDKTLLSASEREKVAAMEKEWNLVRCKIGSGSCDHSLLTPSEQEEVAKLEHQHNLLACRTGQALCTKSLLSAAEAQDVAASQHHRNLLARPTRAFAIALSWSLPNCRKFSTRTADGTLSLALPAGASATVLCLRRSRQSTLKQNRRREPPEH